MAPGRDEHGVGPVARLDVAAHRDRFGRGGGFVEQRRVGDLHAREVTDHRLKIEQRLEAALRDLGLIRRVLGVPAGVLEQVALDDRRSDAAVVAHADVRAPNLVFIGQPTEGLERLGFALGGGQFGRLGEADAARRAGVDHRVERLVAKRREHRPDVVLPRANMPVHKPIRVLRQTVVVVFQNFFGGKCCRPATNVRDNAKPPKRDSRIVNKLSPYGLAGRLRTRTQRKP